MDPFFRRLFTTSFSPVLLISSFLPPLRLSLVLLTTSITTNITINNFIITLNFVYAQSQPIASMIDLSQIPEPLRNPNNCHVDQIPGWSYSYGYRPSLAAGVTFSVIFALALFAHTLQAVRSRRWASILLAMGALSKSAC